MVAIPERFAPALVGAREVCMGSQIATVVLRDGRRFERAVVTGGFITHIHDLPLIPFVAEEVEAVLVTNDTWPGWQRERPGFGGG
ncbi:MAG: hypothetical protein ACKVS8_04790 [Phycisphaerales bacterium]